jgi:hypothetical protein
MQDLLTATIVAITILFTVSAIADFAAGLVRLWRNAGTKAQPRVEAKPPIEQLIEVDPWTLPISEQEIALPAEQPSVKPQLLLAPARVQIATLEWMERNLPPVETFIVEMPCAIAMAKSRLCKTAPVVVELATKAQLQSSGIRKLKQLARALKLSGYGNMRVAQLANALEGKVAAHQLVA